MATKYQKDLIEKWILGDGAKEFSLRYVGGKPPAHKELKKFAEALEGAIDAVLAKFPEDD